MRADRFLNHTEVVGRLIEEYEKYGRLIIAVDFDSTLFDYHKRGDTFPKVIKLVRDAHEIGCKIIIYTCRPKERHGEVVDYLKANSIPFDSINEPIVKLGETDGYGSKIFYSHLLDDRAGLASAYDNLSLAIEVLKNRVKKANYTLVKKVPREKVFTVTIVADSNDADYITTIQEFNENNFNAVALVLKDIKENFNRVHQLEKWNVERYETLFSEEELKALGLTVDDIVGSADYLDVPRNDWDYGYCHTLEKLEVTCIDEKGVIYNVKF